MKKIINAPENYVDEMLQGIYASFPDQVKCAADDPRCYCIANKKPGKVAIITGGGSGHVPLFLGYVGEGLIDSLGSLSDALSCLYRMIDAEKKKGRKKKASPKGEK